MGKKLTKQQIDSLENEPLIGLECDGYSIEIGRLIKKSKVRFLLMIEGDIDPNWLIEPDKHEQSKFYRPAIKYYKASKRSKKMSKVDTGMRKIDYASMGQALRYLNKVCDSIELKHVNYINQVLE
ncbi:hypothetical protein VH441_07405 [Psychrobacter sp. HD31]|uniref:hypothetical protein n=1 Tax=Psychrobacter sp. HD31 TaxID=3112003 RepID=UPI003DA2C3D4